jgi:hypothetical protein
MDAAFQVFSIKEADPKLREIKKRRPHKKTRSGCLSCKAKKVKVSCRHGTPKIAKEASDTRVGVE